MPVLLPPTRITIEPALSTRLSPVSRFMEPLLSDELAPLAILIPPVCWPPVTPLAVEISTEPPMFPALKLRPEVITTLPPVLDVLSPADIVTVPPMPALLPLATRLMLPALSPEPTLAPDASKTDPLDPVLAAPVDTVICPLP